MNNRTGRKAPLCASLLIPEQGERAPLCASLLLSEQEKGHHSAHHLSLRTWENGHHSAHHLSLLSMGEWAPLCASSLLPWWYTQGVQGVSLPWWYTQGVQGGYLPICLPMYTRVDTPYMPPYVHQGIPPGYIPPYTSRVHHATVPLSIAAGYMHTAVMMRREEALGSKGENPLGERRKSLSGP